MTTRPRATKRYRDGWIGAALVAVLIALLISLVPSRVSRVMARFKRPPERAVTWVEVPTFAAVSPVPSTPSVPSPAEDPPIAPPPSAPAATPRSAAPAPPTAEVPAAQRFTIDFGTFPDLKDLEDAERRLKDAGAETVRYRAPSTVAVYVLKIGDFSTTEEAKEALSDLQKRHPALALGHTEPDSQRTTIVPDKRFRLREAVAFAEDLRRAGVLVRLQPAREGEPLFGLRLKSDFDATTARAKGRQLERRGFGNSVIRTATTSS